jgi:hypothetical protein
MAQTTGTYSTYDHIGAREELSDMISMITPDETPCYSAFSKRKLSSKHPEWQTDTLRAPAANAQIEGDNYTFTSKTPTTRIGTYTQIFTETGMITGTADVVDKAGRAKETTREKMKSGLVLRKDIERAIVLNGASAAGSDTVARTFAGFPAWLTTNDDRNGGSDGGFSAGIVAAATNGTQRAFTKTILDNVMANCYNSGGNCKDVYVSTYVKRVQSTFMADTNVAAFRYNLDRGRGASAAENKIVAAADIYLGDFGEVTFHMNRVMTASGATVARNVLFVDPDMVAYGTLRPIQEDEVAKTGDAEPYALVHEGALIMKNEAAHGVAADIFGLTAST